MSGPIADRIDLWIEVPQIEHTKLSDQTLMGESSASIQKRVIKAREIQNKRLSAKTTTKNHILTNSEMTVRDLKAFVPISENIKTILNQAASKMNLSSRGYHRIIKIARTIADLEGVADIRENHILEALQYRPKIDILIY